MRTVYKYVAIVALDGMGNFNLKTPTPCMDKIFENGAVTYYGLSMSPTSSTENWPTMFMGVAPEVHAVLNEVDNGRINTGDRFPTIFKRVRDAMPEAHISSFASWATINKYMIEQDIGVNFYCAHDGDILQPIIDEVANKPTLFFAYFEDIDSAGHNGDWGDENYLKKVTEQDGYVGKIYDAYEKAGILNETLFLVVTDHGGIRCGHGAYSDTERYIYFAAAGKGIEKSEIGTYYTMDMAAVVLYALGLDVPEYEEGVFTSQIPDGLFPEINGTYRKPEESFLEFEERKTPEFKGENGLTKFIPEEKIKLALFMDGDVSDVSGNYETSEVGKVEYVTGAYGKGCILGKNGHINIKGLKFGKESFSVSYWAKVDLSIDEGFCVFSNKNWFWRNRGDHGLGLSFRAHDAVFNMGYGDGRQETDAGFPLTVGGGWIHVIMVADRENKKMNTYFNFKKVYSADMFDRIADLDIDNGMDFNVGNDGLGTFSNEKYEMQLQMDDLIVFGTALTEEDISGLKAYYSLK